MMATSSGGNLKIIEYEGDETSVSATAEPFKEEFGQEKARIILHFFSQDLKDIEEKAIVTVTPEISSGQPKSLIITYTEKRAQPVKELIDKLKADVRDLSEKEIQLDKDEAYKVDNVVQEWKDNKEVFIMPDIATYKVKIVGTTEVLVHKAAYKFKHNLGIASKTNKLDMPPKVPDTSRNTQSFASVVAGKNKLYPDLDELKKKEIFDSKPSAAETSQSSSNGFTRHKPEQSGKSEAVPYKFSSGNDFNFETVLKGGLVLKVYKASITKLSVDVIVNAANDTMMHGGGVARVISEAAGYELDRESADYVQKNGPVKVSKNIVSTAGYLPYRGVIHAVGPVWHEYREKGRCLKDLYKCIWNILTRCEQRSYEKVAMSAISAGIFAVPKPLCADMYVKAAADFSEIREGEYAYPKELHIIDIDTSILQLVKESVEKWQKYPSSLDVKVTLEKYFKDNQYNSGYSPSRNSGHRPRGQRPWGHGTGQEYNSSMSYQPDNKMKDEFIAGTFKPACSLEKKDDEPFAWGGIANVYNFDNQIKVKIFKGEIVKSKGMDAVVCAINKSFQASGYLHESLKKKAGWDFETSFRSMVDNYRNSAGLLDVFKCAGGKLAVSNVIYVVMERVLDGNDEEIQTYQEAIKGVLSKARGWNLRKLVIPMFGTGNIQKNANKLKKCCTALLKGIDSFLDTHGNKSRVTEIHLVNNSDLVCSLLEEVFNEGAGHYQSDDSDSDRNGKKRSSTNDDIGASGQSNYRRHQGSHRKTFTKDGMEKNYQPQEDNVYRRHQGSLRKTFTKDGMEGNYQPQDNNVYRRHQGSSRKTFTKDGMEGNYQPQEDNVYSEIESSGFSDGGYTSGQRKGWQSEAGPEIPQDSAQKRPSKQSVPDEEGGNQEPSFSREQQSTVSGNLNIIQT